LTKKTIGLLQPRKPEFDLTDSDQYFYTVIARPAIHTDALKLLGVKWVIFFEKSVADPEIALFDLKSKADLESVLRGLDYEKVDRRNHAGFYYQGSAGVTAAKNGYIPETIDVIHLKDPLPRVFSIPSSGLAVASLSESSIPRISGQKIFLKEKGYQVTPQKIKAFGLHEVTIEADLKADSYLILSDLFHTNWFAEVDGMPAEMVPAFSIFRAVSAPPGVHQIRFYYRNTKSQIALSVSIASILLIFLGMATRLPIWPTRGLRGSP
jgi:hypothetical protein